MTQIKAFVAAVLYAALATSANPVWAESRDRPNPSAMLTGDMRKLTLAKAPVQAVTTSFVDIENNSVSFADFRDKILLVNFWATWCAPCRKEMPALDALQAELGGEHFQILTIATGPNPIPAILQFFEKTGVKNLPTYRDPQQRLARDMSVFGLPTTLILNREGKEIVRLRGDADWASPEAKAIIKAFIER